MTLWEPSTPIFESFWNESSCPANLGLAKASGPERGGGGASARESAPGGVESLGPARPGESTGDSRVSHVAKPTVSRLALLRPV